MKRSRLLHHFLCLSAATTAFLLLVIIVTSTTVQALTTPTLSASHQLRWLMEQSKDRAIALPGVHDALSAAIFQQTGAECLFLSGFGVSASHLAVPDAGIVTLSEMEDTARRVVNALKQSTTTSSRGNGQTTQTVIPVIVDGDTRFGGCNNMRRQIRAFATAGAACISIEDQIFPKKCTYIKGDKGSNVVSREASVARIKTALAAAKEALEQDGNEILIIARTDCRAKMGLEEAMSRCQEYERMGADMVYAENLQSPEEYQTLRSVIALDTPMILAQVQLNDPDNHPQQRLYSLSEIHDLKYNFALMGVSALQATVQALEDVAREMLTNEGLVRQSKSGSICSFSKLKEVVGFEDVEDFEQSYYCE